MSLNEACSRSLRAPRTWKWRGVLNERFDFRVGEADAREVRVVEREREPRNAADHSLGFAWIRGERADVGLDGENDVVRFRLLDAPGQFILRSLPRIGGRFVFLKVNAWQRCYVRRAEFAGVFERAQKLVAGMLPASGVWLVDRVRDEIRIELQENVGRLRGRGRTAYLAALLQNRDSRLNSRDGHKCDRPSNKPISIPFSSSAADKVEHFVVRQQRKREIRARQSPFAIVASLFFDLIGACLRIHEPCVSRMFPLGGRRGSRRPRRATFP